MRTNIRLSTLWSKRRLRRTKSMRAWWLESDKHLNVVDKKGRCVRKRGKQEIYQDVKARLTSWVDKKALKWKPTEY